jgi:hypothetical protein
MKGLLITALSLLLVGATYAQDNDGDDDGITSERTALDGSPRPTGHMHETMNWRHYTTLAIAPLQYTENGVGLGLSYERALDHEGIISLYMPVMGTFNLKNRYNDNYYYNYNNNYNGNNNNQASVMFYAMPGVKFYPTGMGRVKYAVGPNAVVGVGQKAEYNNMYDPYYSYNYSSYGVYNRFLLGMMVNNSLNINATPHLYIGAEMGFGFTYYDRVGNYNRGVTFLTQGNFKMGYTF